MTWIPFASTPSALSSSLSAGRSTEVTVPGVTLKGDENPSPGMSTVPLVAVRPVMNSVFWAPPLKLPVNASQKSLPSLSGAAWAAGAPTIPTAIAAIAAIVTASVRRFNGRRSTACPAPETSTCLGI